MKQKKTESSVLVILSAVGLIANAVYQRGRKRGLEDGWHVVRGAAIERLSELNEEEKNKHEEEEENKHEEE